MHCDCVSITLADGRYRHICRRCGRTRITRHVKHSMQCGGAESSALKGDWPGAYLKQMLAMMAVHSKLGCQCDDKAAHMNAWGAAGCREHSAEIIEWLREAYKDVPWSDMPLMIARAAAAGLLINPFKPIEWLVDESIRRAASATETK